MKYILWPILAVILVIVSIVELLIFGLICTLSFIWKFRVADVPKWSDMCEKYDFVNAKTFYDRNPIETYVRRLTFGEYKNSK